MRISSLSHPMGEGCPVFHGPKHAHFSPVAASESNLDSPAKSGPVEIAVGADLVLVTDHKLLVFARNEMPDWTVRDFCVVPIHFREHKFYLKSKAAGTPPYAMQYELATWHPGLGMESTRPIYYDEDYVAERDKQARTDRRHNHLHAALFALYPLLGFCWSKFKERVLAMIGFEPVDITEASIMLAFGFFLLEGVFVLTFHAGLLGALLGNESWYALDWILFVIVPLDCAVRFGHIIRGDSTPDGFLEWLFRRRREDGKGSQ